MSAKSVDYGLRALELIDEFQELATSGQIMDRMSLALSEFGFSSFLITTSPDVIGRNTQPGFMLNGWPDGWTKVYSEQNFYRDDPIAEMGRRCVNPFEWSEVRYKPEQSPGAEKIMRTAEDFGLKRGIVVPIVQGNGTMAGVTMAGDRPEFDPMAKRAIYIISLCAYVRTVALLRAETEGPQRVLSEREREVLSWSAAGKSTWDIAKILALSESTVKFHIQRATEKLDAVNRLHAVVNAIRLREIDL